MSDDEPAFFAGRLAIVGLGLMGGSLAMALQGKCMALLGIDPDPYTVELARQMHVVRRDRPAETVRGDERPGNARETGQPGVNALHGALLVGGHVLGDVRLQGRAGDAGEGAEEDDEVDVVLLEVLMVVELEVLVVEVEWVVVVEELVLVEEVEVVTD